MTVTTPATSSAGARETMRQLYISPLRISPEDQGGRATGKTEMYAAPQETSALGCGALSRIPAQHNRLAFPPDAPRAAGRAAQVATPRPNDRALLPSPLPLSVALVLHRFPSADARAGGRLHPQRSERRRGPSARASTLPPVALLRRPPRTVADCLGGVYEHAIAGRLRRRKQGHAEERRRRIALLVLGIGVRRAHGWRRTRCGVGHERDAGLRGIRGRTGRSRPQSLPYFRSAAVPIAAAMPAQGALEVLGAAACAGGGGYAACVWSAGTSWTLRSRAWLVLLAAQRTTCASGSLPEAHGCAVDWARCWSAEELPLLHMPRVPQPVCGNHSRVGWGREAERADEAQAAHALVLRRRIPARSALIGAEIDFFYLFLNYSNDFFLVLFRSTTVFGSAGRLQETDEEALHRH
ncbi:hypothetical protein B0H10DRAFT_2219832 [Mycena sp. CBHHK59/15]|nr:hypothetical protein B0H10DRAFT_2219832 [Mycena sp. CBHHK59/15]